MRNLFLFTACLLSLSVFAQEELARFQIVFMEDKAGWHAGEDYLEWEVWKEPKGNTYPYDWYLCIEEKPEITPEYIENQIEKNRVKTDKHTGDFILWFPVHELGIYHITAKNRHTGEVLGGTVARVCKDTFKLGEIGFVCYDHDFFLLKAHINNSRTTYIGGGAHNPPCGWDPK